MICNRRRHSATGPRRIIATGLSLSASFFIATFFLFYSSVLLGKGGLPPCEKSDTLTFRVVGYNVENLFDCRHDTLKDDFEFLPDAPRHWNYAKYKKKQNDVARVLMAAGGWTLPALVALCEVENDSVLHHLTRYSVLRRAGYRYIVTHSADERGIDVALLYQRHLFKPLSQQCLRVNPPRKDSRPTRDILHVSGLLLSKDTLDVFVCHFPSRSGGARETEPYRLLAAQTVRAAVDSLFGARLHPQILIMGDFNDYPTSPSVKKILQADVPPSGREALSHRALYHLLARKVSLEKNVGSYKYQGRWELLDHIIVSGRLLDAASSFCTDETKADIFRPPFLLTEDKKQGGHQPFRTYYGMKYLGGYSDHLPVLTDFRLIY